MRKRSETLQADTFEEYLQLSIEKGPNRSGQGPAIPESPYCYLPEKEEKVFRITPDFIDTSVEDILDSKFVEGMDQNTNYEIQMEIDSYDSIKTPSTDAGSRNQSRISTSFDCDAWSSSFFSPKSNSSIKFEKTRVLKTMVIGRTGAGKHTLIDTVFGQNDKGEQKLRNPFDLVIKHQDQDGYLNTIKFWLRDPSDEKIEPLIKVYYKSINLYIFIYKVDDRKSFECLDREILKVKKEVSDEKFKGLLIGNKPNQSRCEDKVSYEEGAKLQQKYNLAQFVEMEYCPIALEKVLSDFIYPKEKRD